MQAEVAELNVQLMSTSLEEGDKAQLAETIKSKMRRVSKLKDEMDSKVDDC